MNKLQLLSNQALTDKVQANIFKSHSLPQVWFQAQLPATTTCQKLQGFDRGGEQLKPLGTHGAVVELVSVFTLSGFVVWSQNMLCVGHGGAL